MNTAEQVLVVIVSSLLSLALILGIVLLVYAIKLVKNVRRVTAKAEQLVEDAESAASMFRNAAGPLTMLKTIANIVDAVTNHKKRK
jgi:heme O synthase-like polyprenyltransferase